jgi:hypothetical protein
MTTTTIEVAQAHETGMAGTRIGAAAGTVFALCLFAGVAMLGIPRGASDQELVSWWSDRGNQATAVISMYLFVLAGLSFLVFLAKLRSRLLEAEGRSGELTSLAFAGGIVFVAMLFVAGASRGVIGFATLSPANDEALPGPDTLRYLPQIGYAVTGTAGLLSATLTVGVTSILVFRTRVFGRWLAWLGAVVVAVVAAAAALLSAVFAIPALLAWAVATSVALWRRPRSHTKGRMR